MRRAPKGARTRKRRAVVRPKSLKHLREESPTRRRERRRRCKKIGLRAPKGARTRKRRAVVRPKPRQHSMHARALSPKGSSTIAGGAAQPQRGGATPPETKEKEARP